MVSKNETKTESQLKWSLIVGLFICIMYVTTFSFTGTIKDLVLAFSLLVILILATTSSYKGIYTLGSAVVISYAAFFVYFGIPFFMFFAIGSVVFAVTGAVIGADRNGKSKIKNVSIVLAQGIFMYLFLLFSNHYILVS